MKNMFFAAAVACAAFSLAGCDKASDAQPITSTASAKTLPSATGNLAATDSTHSGWWAVENLTSDCVDNSSPAEVIQLATRLHERYSTIDTLDERGDISATVVQVPDQNMQVTFYRSRTVCLAVAAAPKAAAAADEKKYGGTSVATVPEAASDPDTSDSSTVSASARSAAAETRSRYLEKVQRLVRPKIIWDGATEGLATVISVRCSPNGALLSATIKSSSGSAGWDATALKAVQNSDPMPLDADGKTPATFEITMRPVG